MGKSSTVRSPIPNLRISARARFQDFVYGRADWPDQHYAGRGSLASGNTINVSNSPDVQGVGGLIGQSANRSVIDSRYAEGTVTNYAQATGGLVGNMRISTISGDWAKVKVEGSDLLGGIAGTSDDDYTLTHNLVLGDLCQELRLH